MLNTTSTQAVEVDRVGRTFGDAEVLRQVSLTVAPGSIHALLGPNGAGKTTLLRIVAGITEPTSGATRILGAPPDSWEVRRLVGWVPSGDRTFYLRISGLENLIFFGRLHGLSRPDAHARAEEVLAAVGLQDAARKRVGLYSHGMQKRLSVARALLTEAPVLILDEATHDLDPRGAGLIRDLITERSRRGAAVLWATQRIDEIRSFAQTVTVLGIGEVRFDGTVASLIDRALVHVYAVVLELNGVGPNEVTTAVRDIGAVEHIQGDRYRLSLKANVALGDAIIALSGIGIRVLSCSAERSDLEEAFLLLTEDTDD